MSKVLNFYNCNADFQCISSRSLKLYVSFYSPTILGEQHFKPDPLPQYAGM